MAWTDVNFNEVNPGVDLIAEGDYTFMLLSASRSRYDAEAFDVKLSVATTGPACGQTVYMKYPNPAKSDKNQPADSPSNWVNKRFKLLLEALAPYGFKIQQGEHPVEFLSRVANEAEEKNEQVYFDARIGHDKFPDKETGEIITRHKIALASVKPVQQ